VLTFLAPPDFERPADADRDDVYLVQISASDGKTTTPLNLSVTVTNLPDGGYRVRKIASLGTTVASIAPAPPSATGQPRIFAANVNGLVQLVTPSTGEHGPFIDLGPNGLNVTPFPDGLRDFRPAPGFGVAGGTWAATYISADNNLTLNIGSANGDHGVLDYRAGILGAGFSPGEPVGWGGKIVWTSGNEIYLTIGVGTVGNYIQGQEPNQWRGVLLRYDFTKPVGSDVTVPAWGLRRPSAMSWDPALGLLIADQGASVYEEVNLFRLGETGVNFGWPYYEGTQQLMAGAPAGLRAPVIQYPHSANPLTGAIAGGVVYRGPIASLKDHYIFADTQSGEIWSVLASDIAVGTTLQPDRFFRHTADFTPDQGILRNPVAFGLGADGALYIGDYSGAVFVVEPA
jgi:hypothetical protein